MAMAPKQFRYQDQDCPMTLCEGLREYYAGHPGLLQPDRMEADAARFFRSHDACHALFGLDTTLVDEGLADLWTLLATSVGVRRYAHYLRTNPAAKQITKEIGLLRVLRTTMQIIPFAITVFLRSRKMTGKWPWNSEDSYLNQPLNVIRNEFNIRIL